jgi:CRP-like cAMP-binding protein
MHEKPDYQAVRNSFLGVELTEEESRSLADIMGIRKLSDGEILVAEGTLDNTLYLLIAGRLAVSNIVEGKEVAAYFMQIGESAGTRAFVDGTERKANLRAVGDTIVYTLKPEAFEALVDTHPRIVYKVMRALFRTAHANLMRMNLESAELTRYITKTHGRY